MSLQDGRQKLQWGRVRVNAEVMWVIKNECVTRLLQWGRVRVNAEVSGGFGFGAAGGPASMGPRSCERGSLPNPDGFGEAFHRLQWGRVRVNAEVTLFFHVASIIEAASMGPRSCERGSGLSDTLCAYGRKLQWGRVRVNAEVLQLERQALQGPRFNGAAFV